VSTFLDRFIAIAASPPTEERWQQLFMSLPDNAEATEEWTRSADSALVGWPPSLRAAFMTDYDVEPHGWMWPLGRETEAVSWLRLVRALWAATTDVLAAPPDGGWKRYGFQSLEELYVVGPLGTVIDLAAVIPSMPALTTLDLSRSVAWGMSAAQVRAGWAELLEVAASARLTTLRAGGLPLDGAEWRQLATSALASRLRTLDLSASRAEVGPDGWLALAGWPADGCLEELRLVSVGLGDSGASAIWNAETLTSTRVLALGSNGLTDAFTATIAGQGRERLVELDLRSNLLTDRSVDHFVASALPALRRLNVDGNRLTRDGRNRLLAWAATRPGLQCTVTSTPPRVRTAR
jgi:hypothetical protein